MTTTNNSQESCYLQGSRAPTFTIKSRLAPSFTRPGYPALQGPRRPRAALSLSPPIPFSLSPSAGRSLQRTLAHVGRVFLFSFSNLASILAYRVLSRESKYGCSNASVA
jgi:hypothetical protein